MYKIYYYDKCLKLARSKDSRRNLIDTSLKDKTKVKDELELAMKYLYTNGISEDLCIFSQDLEFLWKKFMAEFKFIEAAGGIVRNREGRILMIYRNDKWDLPKGKFDEDESPEQAALREVQEECGIKKLEIGTLVDCSYHLFETPRNTVLKKTWWFNMTYYGNREGKPQEEENITKLKWFKPENLKKPLKNTYPIVISLLSESSLRLQLKETKF